jgi:hypothetical protein
MLQLVRTVLTVVKASSLIMFFNVTSRCRSALNVKPSPVELIGTKRSSACRSESL